MKILMNILILLNIFLVLNNHIYAAETNLCSSLFNSDISNHIRKNIGTVDTDKTSFTQVQISLVNETARKLISDKVIRYFGGESGLARSQFFSQFTIEQDGTLQTISDPTIEKDQGAEVASSLSQDNELRGVFKQIYLNIQRLASEIRFALPETEIELAEALFTLQINKVSENWHLDWYPQEYLIATQTFLAQRLSKNGSLVDEKNAGTEYLLIGDLPEVMNQILTELPRRFEFRVNTTPPINLIAKGFQYNSPTGALTIHSGIGRVHALLNIPASAIGYNLVSPPHRGSYKDLAIRGSLAIRFKPKQ